MAEKENKMITEEELATHNTAKDCWVGLHNLVLNLGEDFLNEHPGGPDVVSCLAGKDCSKDFEDIAHSDSAREWASKFIIGYKEGAPEESQQLKAIPRAGDVSGGSAGGNNAMLIAVFMVLLAGAAFFFMKAIPRQKGRQHE